MKLRVLFSFLICLAVSAQQVTSPGGGGVGVGAANLISESAGPVTSLPIDITILTLTTATQNTLLVECKIGTGFSGGHVTGPLTDTVHSTPFLSPRSLTSVTANFTSATNVVCTANSNGGAGATGPAGPVGSTGAEGATGTAGAVGPTGPSGSAGTAGAPGAPGAPGATGSTGPSGAAGSTGPSGPPNPEITHTFVGTQELAYLHNLNTLAPNVHCYDTANGESVSPPINLTTPPLTNTSYITATDIVLKCNFNNSGAVSATGPAGPTGPTGAAGATGAGANSFPVIISNQTSYSISGATHGQGNLALPFCWDNSSPRVLVQCGKVTRDDSTGDLAFTWSGAAFSGRLQVVGAGTSSAGFLYERSITVNHTQVPSNQTNIPVVVQGTLAYLATVAGKVTQTTGNDIWFTSDSLCTNKLNWEKVSYNSSTGAVEYWVQFPTLSSTVDTVAWMCYGNLAATTDQSNPTAVWPSSIYAYVGHMNITGSSVTDSTANAYVGTIGSDVTSVAGEIGSAANLIGSGNSYITAASSFVFSSLDLTVSAWVYSTHFSQAGAIGDKEPVNSGWLLNLSTGAGVSIRGNSPSSLIASPQPTNSNWHLLHGQIDHAVSPTASLFYDGVLNVSLAGIVDAISNTTDVLNIGRYSGSGGGYNCDCIIDEFRVRKDIETQAEITIEENNQKPSSTFFAVGSEVAPH